MSQIKFLWTEENVGKRVGVYPPEEGDRTKPYSEKYWSEIETLPLERIREIQWQRFLNLINFAYKNSPFYYRKWREAKVEPKDIKAWEDIQKIPIVTKYDFQRDQEETPPYGTAFTSPPHTQLKYWQTSGTTAKPRLWTETKEDWENGVFLYSRALYAQGAKPGWRAFVAFSYPPFIAFWLGHSTAEAMGCQVVPKGPMPTQAWLRLIENLAQTNQDSFIMGTPTHMIRHVEVAEREGIDLSKLNIKILSMAGEPGPTNTGNKRYMEEA